MKAITKKALAGALLLCLMAAPLCGSLGGLIALPVMAADCTLTTDKTEYNFGEPILVTATGAEYDWVGLYDATATGKTSAAYWYYVGRDGHHSGDTVDIHNADNVNAVDCPHLMGIPAGQYRITLCLNNGYDVGAEVLITVKEPTAPTDPSNILSVSKTEYREGEPIVITAKGTGTDWVGLYRAEDDVANSVVGYWYYVAKDGNKSGQAVTLQNVAKFDGARSDIAGIPAGDYKLVFFFNNSYQAITEVPFRVVTVDKPAAPKTVTYQSAGKGIGRAAGTVTVTAADGVLPFSYELWWGNAEGKLAGYTSLGSVPCNAAETKVTLPDNIAIPAGADRILVYASNVTAHRGDLWSDEATAGLLPADVAGSSFGELKKSFAVLSDLHLYPDSEHPYNRQFAAALAELQAAAPGLDGIFINGDVTDHGIDSEFAAYRAILEAAGELPPVYAAVGNHDLYGQGTDAMRIDRFLKGTGNPSETVYFDTWVKGIHCLFLGSEELTAGDGVLSEAQLSWLSARLDEDKAAGRMTFLFMHQGLKSTVAGTKTQQAMGYAKPDEALRAILEKHPQAVLFSGHSHWPAESKDTFLPATDKLPTMLSTSATSVLWNDNGNRSGISLKGSQAYCVFVYEGHILFAARDLLTGEWLSGSLFVMDTACDTASETPDTPPVPAAEDDTAADTVTEAPAETVTDPESAADTAADTKGTADKTGCTSAVGAGLALSLSLAGALALTIRPLRKKED